MDHGTYLANWIMMLRVCFLVALISLGPSISAQERQLLRIDRSSVAFISEAPQERIEASTGKTTGVMDLDQRTFAIQVPMRSLEGFNSPLQREHFNENYLLSEEYPFAVFQGRIIEEVDLSGNGEYRIRAKGGLTIRGVEKERIIACTVSVLDSEVTVTGSFPVVLNDHAIRVPKVVQQKLASTVEVSVDLHFLPGKQER